MKKLIVMSLAAVLSLGVSLGTALAADAPAKAAPVTNFGKKDPVMFDHAKHKDVKCVACHHNEADGKYKCGECHKAEAAGKAISLKDASHGKTGACYTCHYDKDAKNKLKCADCHKK